MDLALSRLGMPATAGSADACDGSGEMVTCVPDDGQWRSLITEFTGAMIPPMLTPARTRGPRSFYVGIDTSITGISSGSRFWHRGTEGDRAESTENPQVDNVLAWTRL